MKYLKLASIAMGFNLFFQSAMAVSQPSCESLLLTSTPSLIQGREIHPVLPAYPRQIDPAQTFNSLVKWVHDEIIIKRKAPGLLIGVSGTDSIVAFLVAAKAYELAGKPDHVVGIHFAPSEDLLEENPAAESHLWFQNEVIPWLKKQAPHAKIIVDTSIDFRRDGLRWGALMDWSVVDYNTRKMRPPEERFWVVGTRNATEEALYSYSNASKAASVQILNQLWKSEILQLSAYLKTPQIAINKSCEVDCVCGRMSLPAQNIPEVDAILMARRGLLDPEYLRQNIPSKIRELLEEYVREQIQSASFKEEIPYKTSEQVVPSHKALHELSFLNIKTELGHSLPTLDQQRRLNSIARDIVDLNDTRVASDFVLSLEKYKQILLPEILTTFKTPGLRANQLRQMILAVFSPAAVPWSNQDLENTHKILAHIADYAFSFPQWRFLSMRAGGGTSSLAEAFGMTALARVTDTRDVSLPASNPARDELGKGYSIEYKGWHIEYRRAYILISNLNHDKPVTLIIRNSSFFFGRDRLSEAVYFSFAEQNTEELNAISDHKLWQSDTIYPFSNLLNRQILTLSTTEKMARLNSALNALDSFNSDMSKWMTNSIEAKNIVTALAKKFLDQNPARIPFYLATVTNSSPSWSVSKSIPLSIDTLTKLEHEESLTKLTKDLDRSQGRRLVITSGHDGDLP